MGDRIRRRRIELGLTQEQVAELVGVSKASVSSWESQAHSLRGSNLLALARALKTTPSWIQYGGMKDAEDGPPIRAKVPLISWAQAGTWTEIADAVEPGTVSEWRETTATVSPNAFALRMAGDSMVNPHGSPSIPEGSVIIVDPEVEPESGKIVVVKLKGSQEVTVKKLVLDGPNVYLAPLNPNYRPIQVSDEDYTIIGVALKVEFDL
jgi:SOS-response transcriptional repressor LexA